MRLAPGLLALALAARAAFSQAEIATIHINAAKPGPEINPRMYGIFLEEIKGQRPRLRHPLSFRSRLVFLDDSRKSVGSSHSPP